MCFFSTKFIQVFMLQAMKMQCMGTRLKQWEDNNSRYVVHGFISIEGDTLLFNTVHVHVHCLLHGLWSPVLVCVGCGYANVHKVLWWLAKWHKM